MGVSVSKRALATDVNAANWKRFHSRRYLLNCENHCFLYQYRQIWASQKETDGGEHLLDYPYGLRVPFRR
jgi:hypothetical protein